MVFVAILIIVGLAVLLQNIVYRRFGLQNVEYRCYLSTQEAYEGDEIELVEELCNRKRLPIPWLRSEIVTSKWLDFAHSQSSVIEETRFVPSFFMMKGYHKVERRWRVKCLRFGIYRIEKAEIVATDLLGNVNLSMAAHIRSAITVLPRPAVPDELDYTSRRLLGEIEVRRRFLPDPFYVVGVREYTEYDPVGRVNWLATAREQKLMVHQCGDTARQNLAVVWNMQSREKEDMGMYDPESVANAGRVCASCLDATLRSGIPVRLLVNGGTKEEETIHSAESWGHEHVLELFRLMARVKLQRTETLPRFLKRSFPGEREVTDIVLVTCYVSPEMLLFAREKGAQGIQVKILCVGPIAPELDCGGCEVHDVGLLFSGRSAAPSQQGPEAPSARAG